jgi:hypothetical protein
VPSAVNFGSVPLGQQATQTIDITNVGNLPAAITAAALPQVPFGTPQPIAAGLPVNPGYDRRSRSRSGQAVRQCVARAEMMADVMRFPTVGLMTIVAGSSPSGTHYW